MPTEPDAFPHGYTPPAFRPGEVWLAGAGPGDAGLVTLQTLHALRQADVIVFDALVSPSVLALAPAATPREYAGKRGGRPSPRQADISLRLVRLARQGKRVLRLKGGDPFVFGRGGEEALALAGAGVPFRVLPGVTAGIGGLAYAGIPVTHRETNHAVTFITGHDTSGGIAGIDWEGLAQGSPVLVLYMALKHLSEIACRLIAAGRSADEPVAVVAAAATERQRVLETSLAAAAGAVAEAGLEPPAVIAIGEVVRLRAGLDWLGALSGRVLEPDPLGLRQRSDCG